MTINGWDISNANAKQWNVRRGYSAITNISEWMAGVYTPAIFPGKAGFKTLQITLVVKAANKEAVQLGISTILQKLMEPATIILDNYSRKFYGYLKSYTVDESSQRPTNPFHKLTLNLEGYEYSDQVSASGKNSISVNNPGTLPTPAVVTVVSTRAVSNVTINGLGKTITIPTLTANKQVIINGETGLMTVDGSLANLNIWNLPYITPGSNTITVSDSYTTVTITFKPRYM